MSLIFRISIIFMVVRIFLFDGEVLAFLEEEEEEEDAKASPRRILGGYEVKNFNFPWQVSIRKKNRHHCGGSLISNDLVITAAHCLVNVRKRLTVRVGSPFREKGGTLIEVKKIVWHDDYETEDEMNNNDIGLVFLKRSLVFNSSVRPIFLPKSFTEIPAGLGVVSSGWGTVTYPLKNYPQVLSAVNMKILANSKCAEILGPGVIIAEVHICAYSGAKGRGMCQGDSGGPLFYDDILLGVASWGIPCAQGMPDVFTKVSHYIGWILREYLENIIENEVIHPH